MSDKTSAGDLKAYWLLKLPRCNRLHAFNSPAIASPELSNNLRWIVFVVSRALDNRVQGKGREMRAQNSNDCSTSETRNYHLTLDPWQVNFIGAAFEEAWLQFTALAPAGLDLFAEASIRQLIAIRIIRAARSGEFDRNTLVALALRGL